MIGEDRPLPPHTMLDIWECYAKVILEETYPDVFKKLDISDRPDLQNVKQSIGVEVTSAINEKQREAEALYSLWCQESDENEKAKLETRIVKTGAVLTKYSLFGIPGTDSFGRVLKALNDKLTKLNSGMYRQLNHYHLFVLSDILANDEMVDDALYKAIEISDKFNFRFKTVNCYVPGHMYVLNIVEQQYSIVNFDSEAQFNHGELARRMVIDFENANNKNQ